LIGIERGADRVPAIAARSGGAFARLREAGFRIALLNSTASRGRTGGDQCSRIQRTILFAAL
jgi:hypothetical protein